MGTVESSRIDTLSLKQAARRVVGANVTMRSEKTTFPADIASASNHYIAKAANVLDRVRRAEGTAADWPRRKTLRVHQEEADISNNTNEDRGAHTIIWEAHGVHIMGPRACDIVKEELQFERGENTWEITSRNKRHTKKTRPQNSFYNAAERAIWASILLKQNGVRK